MNKKLPYKALILDLDGTTLVHGIDSLPSKRVHDAISKVRKYIHVCIATGRPLSVAQPVLNHLDLSGPSVINNGAILYDSAQRKVVKKILLSRAKANEILALTKKFKLLTLANNGYEDLPLSEVPDDDLLGIYFPEISPDILVAFDKKLESVPNVIVHKMPSWKKDHAAFFVSDVNASKLHGITEICGLLTISSHELIGVGDGYNDFPLLMACGLKFAMGNAVPELKAIADFVAPSVEDDGVAVIIEKFILPLLSTS